MSTLCVCGHAEGYHDAESLLDSSDGLCSIWACYCDEHELAEQATLLEGAE